VKLSLEVDLPDGYSDETVAQTRKVLGVLAEYAVVFAARQQNYGRGNIDEFGEKGVFLRLHDKERRLKSLVWDGLDPTGEPTRDTWQDALGYSAIGLLCHDGQW